MSTAPFLCLSVPDLGTQIVRRRGGPSEAQPVIVVEGDRPSARVSGANRAAVEIGIRVGMRYAEALSLSRSVYAGIVSDAERLAALDAIVGLLKTMIPDSERWDLLDTVVWGDIRGMERLGGGTPAWLGRLADAVGNAGWLAGVAVGWTRPGTFLAAHAAAARVVYSDTRPPESAAITRTGASSGSDGDTTVGHDGKTVAESEPTAVDFTFQIYRFAAAEARIFVTRQKELRWYRNCPIDPLPLTGRDRERLAMLGIKRIRDITAISAHAFRHRLSNHLQKVHRFVSDNDGPIPPRSDAEPQIVPPQVHRYEPPLRTDTALGGTCRRLIEAVVPVVVSHGRWIRGVRFLFTDDLGRSYPEVIECGRVTRDAAYVLRLVSMRLENRRWRAREITAITFSVTLETPEGRQAFLGDFLKGDRSIDRDEIDETIAVLRAHLGNDRVFRIRLRPARLPEHRYRKVFELSARNLVQTGVNGDENGTGEAPPSGDPNKGDTALRSDGAAERNAGVLPQLRLSRVRRIRTGPPVPFPRVVPPVQFGPFVYAAEWWRRDDADRVYTYHRDRNGTILWLYRDVAEGTWMFQGWLE